MLAAHEAAEQAAAAPQVAQETETAYETTPQEPA